ncbi:MAG: hypothetical protein HN712_15225 [Gemmatimonadetes bacterium]|jgi:hypothetical protein|nr:hypothetical protein [Gemmatimonadota bacterium]
MVRAVIQKSRPLRIFLFLEHHAENRGWIYHIALQEGAGDLCSLKAMIVPEARPSCGGCGADRVCQSRRVIEVLTGQKAAGSTPMMTAFDFSGLMQRQQIRGASGLASFLTGFGVSCETWITHTLGVDGVALASGKYLQISSVSPTHHQIKYEIGSYYTPQAELSWCQ